MLPEHCDNLWQAYLATEKVRIRVQSKAALRAFIEEIGKVPVEIRDRWAIDLTRRVVDQNDQCPVRMPLFREVLFPALKTGFLAGIDGCARWLAGFSQLLCQSPDCLAELPETARSARGLLLQALEVDPNDKIAKQRLIGLLSSQFEYSLHELPAGVLYDQNGATLEQCVEMEQDLRLLESLAEACGTTAAVEDILKRARFHIRTYREYLQTRKSGDTYAQYLTLKKQ